MMKRREEKRREERGEERKELNKGHSNRLIREGVAGSKGKSQERASEVRGQEPVDFMASFRLQLSPDDSAQLWQVGVPLL